MKYVLALDAGTTSTRAIIFAADCQMVGVAQREFQQYYPQPAWVEHNANEIWQSQYAVTQQVLQQTGIEAAAIAAIGITNQRETTIIWDKETGEPICNAIVWQDRRTAPICEELRRRGLASYIQKTTGLVIDAYFSATKIKYILDTVPHARQQAEEGRLLFGTVDCWLLWKLTAGRRHITDYSNAARTMMYDINRLQWDKKILQELDIPEQLLPTVQPSSCCYGTTAAELFDGVAIPIAGIAGDQQAALFGQNCFQQGMIKNTYGTGCFILMNIGDTVKETANNLLTTIAWGIGDKVEYAFEGAVFIGGAIIQWLRDQLGLLQTAGESSDIALALPDAAGVYIVPAFAGLGAPYWDMYARGCIQGLTSGVTSKHLVRAALESIAYQSRDVIECMKKDAGLPIPEIRVDGGAAANNFLLQFQADITGITVTRPKNIESTARGAAALAGLAVGLWQTREEISQLSAIDCQFDAQFGREQRQKLYSGWQKAVVRAQHWAD